MCKQHAYSYCPTCDTYRPADQYLTRDPDTRPRCHGCGNPLVLPAAPGLDLDDPQILTLVAGLAARFLIARGLLTALDQKANDPHAKIAGEAFAYARILLKEAAKL